MARSKKNNKKISSSIVVILSIMYFTIVGLICYSLLVTVSFVTVAETLTTVQNNTDEEINKEYNVDRWIEGTNKNYNELLKKCEKDNNCENVKLQNERLNQNKNFYAVLNNLESKNMARAIKISVIIAIIAFAIYICLIYMLLKK